jgi:Protein of unknown function (DUF3105)
VVACSVAGCGGGENGPDSGGACGVAVRQHAAEGAMHVPNCSTVSYQANPPCSGNHYSVWGAFGVYDAPLPRGFWVHNLEHGAVVISYNCPDGCPDDLARAKAFVASPPEDPECGSGGQRVLLVPDPLLDVTWGASAWRWNLRAHCFDEDAFRSFYMAHYNDSPEDVCSPGDDYRNPDGTLSVPAGCGQ